MRERAVHSHGQARRLTARLAWVVLLGLASWGCGGGGTSDDVADELSGDGVADALPDATSDGSDDGVAPAAACPELPDGTPCSDGDPCTSPDLCLAGACVGTAVDCSWRDGVCTKGTCEPPLGECVALPVDDGTTCDDGDPYTDGEACRAGACEGGTAVSCHGTADGIACDDGNPCTQDDRCGANECHGLPLADGTACDDHDACTTGDVCLEGLCRANAVDCTGLVTTCASAACDQGSGECVVTPRAEGQACDDGSACTTDDTCLGGACVGADQCICKDVPDGGLCDDGRACTQGDACASELCVGQPVLCAPSTALCRVTLCLEIQGGCVEEAQPDGTPCDDGDPCTVGGACLDGDCAGAVNTCFCADKADGTPCDDANPCTIGDACTDQACAGTPRDCSASGDGACMQGVCDMADGSCVAAPLPNGTPCDDSLPCTLADACTFGKCLGQPMVCPSDACNVGSCDPASGACAFTPRPKGTPCDDEKICTGEDGCDGGVCKGTIDVCKPCADNLAAEACDDGDACTSDTLCSPFAAGLVCLGTAVDCSHLDDACTITRCNPADGACSTTIDRADGTPCDDGDACSSGDACSAGTCKGTAIGTCGATFGACEPAGLHLGPADAASIPLEGGEATLLGFIDPPGDEDWYRVHLEASEHLSLTTRPHCDSVLDTRLGLVAPDGATLLADDDNGGGDGWSAIDGFEVPATGDYFVVVNAFPASGVGTYLLAVHAASEACVTDADCGCARLACSAGACVPTLPGEVEPNDDAADASVATYADGVEVRGDVSTLTDEDWFTLELPANTVLGITAAPMCQAAVQLRLTLFAGDGVTPVAEGAAGGDGASASVGGLYLTQPTTYRARVTSLNASLGAYVLSVSNDSCHTSPDCQCVDRCAATWWRGTGGACPCTRPPSPPTARRWPCSSTSGCTGASSRRTTQTCSPSSWPRARTTCARCRTAAPTSTPCSTCSTAPARCWPATTTPTRASSPR